MYGKETIDRAIELRQQGTAIKEIARILGTSVGWAHSHLKDVPAPVVERSRLLVASQDELKQDRMRFSVQRLEWLAQIGEQRRETRWRLVDEVIQGTGGLARKPRKAERVYKTLDNIQTLFGREPSHWLFALVEQRAPVLLSHLVKWARTDGKGDRPGTRASFVPMLMELAGFLKENERAPVGNARDARERNLAKFVTRWKANGLGRGDRPSDQERAEAMKPICRLVDRLRSDYADDRAWAVSRIRDGHLDGMIAAAEQSESPLMGRAA